MLVAAKYAGVSVDIEKDFTFGVTNKSESYLKKNPFGKVPIADTQSGPIFESSIIAYHLVLSSDKADELLGKTVYEKTLVLQYILMMESEFNHLDVEWRCPILGFFPYDSVRVERAKKGMLAFLGKLNKIVASKAFLVGEIITLADICVACSLLPLYKTVLDRGEREPFENLNNWFTSIINQPNFKSILQDTSLIEKALLPSPSSFGEVKSSNH